MNINLVAAVVCLVSIVVSLRAGMAQTVSPTLH